MSRLIVAGGTIVTMDAARRIVRGDVIIDDGQIVEIVQTPTSAGGHDAAAQRTAQRPAQQIDASGCIVLPGLVQAHTHLCQTLCRGAADDLPLLAWLRQRVWPYEAALDERAMRACARLAAAELLLGGTTAILDMGTVHETDALFDAVAATGLRATIGKAMMDAGDGVPARILEETRRSVDESDALAARWDGAADGRLRYAYAPRFVLSCTEELLREVGARVHKGARLHTHASEQEAEIAIVRRERGADNIVYLESLGLGGPRAALAHCVHATDDERRRLAASGTHVVHCPSSNLKLGSGIAPIPEMLAQGIHVALGADGAPCNNNLDGFVELRLAALLHKPRAGATAMPAETVLELATRGGAAALGLEDRIGSLEVGKRADLIVVEPRTPHATPSFAPVSTLVYATQSRDVRDVIVDGRLLVRNGALTALTGLDRDEVVATAQAEAERVQSRVRA
ncbi:MAG: Cytosine deaminase-like metal-dependent hydrolase [Myxococcales bacterium]|nr:Cytosine deaminase-like metal-dependent hydrolase [Myxococcales bacterium]